MRWQPYTLGFAVALVLAGCRAAGKTPIEEALPVSARPQGDLPGLARLQSPDEPVRTTGSLLQDGNKQFGPAGSGQVAVRIRAYVNGIPILDDEVREAAYARLTETVGLPDPERTNRQRQIIVEELERLIDREVILSETFAKLKDAPKFMDKLQEAAGKEFDKAVRSYKDRAKKSGLNIKTDEELKALLRQQGQSLEGIRRQVERSFISMEYMRSRIFPIVERNTGHQAIEAYYQEHQSEFQIDDRVVWQDIFLDATRYANRGLARQFAEHLIARVQRGEDFALLAKQYDQGDSSFRNGEGYGQKRGEIRPTEAEPILFALQPGQIGPIIEQANGLHIIRLVEREHAGFRPLDEKTQHEIKKKLQNLIADREYKRILTELKRKATIERDVEP